MSVFSTGVIENVVFKSQKNVNQGGGIHFADFTSLKYNIFF